LTTRIIIHLMEQVKRSTVQQKMPAHLKVFIYRTAIRPSLTYWNETWPGFTC